MAAGVIHYRISTTVVNQLIALDIVSLVAIAPLSVVAGGLLLRGHRAGPPLATGPAAFTAYMIAPTRPRSGLRWLRCAAVPGAPGRRTR